MDVLYLIEQETKRRGYSPRTTETYCGCVRKFMRWAKKEPRKVTRKDIQGYVDVLVSKNSSGSTVNVYVNALKFLMEEILGKRILLRVRYSRIPKRLPTVLSKDEVNKLIAAIDNPKHKLMIELMYSAGLRVSELSHLKVKDLELGRGLGWVRRGKGGKDRMFIIARKIDGRLRDFVRDCPQDSFVFSGRKGRPISIRVTQEAVKQAARKAGLRKDVHCHTLRHSFATHLIENGCNILSLQHLMGHSDPDTTRVYIHTAKPRLMDVRSPYDDL